MKRKFRVGIGNKTFVVEVEEIEDQQIEPSTSAQKGTTVITTERSETPTEKITVNEILEGEIIEAPLPGTIISIMVKENDRVDEDDIILILESMKMENEIYAPFKGIVNKIFINIGQQVNKGEQLMLISKQG